MLMVGLALCHLMCLRNTHVCVVNLVECNRMYSYLFLKKFICVLCVFVWECFVEKYCKFVYFMLTVLCFKLVD